MAKPNKRWGTALFSLFIILPFIFGACKQVMGFGGAIDLQPPVLYLDSVPNPWYVKNSAVLSGTVIDNVGIGRIVIRDAVYPEKEFGTARVNGNRWEITLTFTEEDNNRKISAEIVAWDKAGNSGDESVQFVNLFVDLSPPFFDEPVIQRSSTRNTSLFRLYDLVSADENSLQNVDMFQNGSFWITADVTEEETYARTVFLYLYDKDNDIEGEHVYQANFDNANPFAPQWTIHEADIIATDKAKSLNYKSRLENGERIYLRVTLVAHDLADNPATYGKREDYGYLCLSRVADKPKALLAGGVGQFIPPGTEIPIDVFDDDTILEAYVDLLTITQFNSYGGDDASRLASILGKLSDNPRQVVPNWRDDLGYPLSTEYDSELTNRVTGSTNPESMTVVVNTGSTSADCMEYRLVAFVRDAKTDPHAPGTESVWNSFAYSFSLVDNNAALIVIDTVITDDVDYSLCHWDGPNQVHLCGHLGHDLMGLRYTSGNSPEENTFPNLNAGQFFEISGYTLDELSPISSGGIDTFRIAWVPFGIPGGQDASLESVRRALANDTGYPDGVQHWTLTEAQFDAGKDSYFVRGADQEISGVNYAKQVFKKKFDILGGVDDLDSSYRNFHYGCNPTHTNNCRENDSKLFVLYAKNSKGNETYRTIRILGNTNPPILRIYDLTGLTDLNSIDDELALTPALESDQSHFYSTIVDEFDILVDTDSYLAPAFKPYPLHKVYKLYVKAQKENDVQIGSLTMEDVSSGTPLAVGYLNPGTNDITFVTRFSTLTQKVYRFVATNMLDESIRIERTVSITNTAQLTALVASEPAGTYGQGSELTLRAQFSALVMVRRTSGNGPLLNVRYETGGPGSDVWKYVSIPYTEPALNTATGYLDFAWEVPDDANGRLETVDEGNQGTYDSVLYDRPILLNGAEILDFEREDNAFLPGYMLDWTNNPGNLQGGNQGGILNDGKEIILDGILPKITAVFAGGKERYVPDDGNTIIPGMGAFDEWYYFNPDNTIEFEIYADKPIRNDGVPKVEFQVQKPDLTTPATWYAAEYLRPETRPGQTYPGLMFTIPAGTVTDDGRIVNLRLTNEEATQGKVVDMVGNRLATSDLGTRYSGLGKALIVDKTAPPQALPLLNGAAPKTYYNVNPVLTIPQPAGTNEPWGSFRQYSLEDGSNWTNIDTSRAGWTSDSSGSLTVNSGNWNLVVRHIDKAGNGAEVNWSPVYEIDIEANFPKLLSVRVVQQRGIYKGGQTLDFVLEFERAVKTVDAGEVANTDAYIVIADRDVDLGSVYWPNIDSSDQTVFNGPQDLIKIPVTLQTVNNKTSLTFSWDIKADSKNMTHGITIAQINLDGVTDLYGNIGGNTGEGTANITLSTIVMPPDIDAIPNLNGIDHKIISFKPVLVETKSIPRNGNASTSGNTNAWPATHTTYPGHARIPEIVLANRSQIKLVFSHDIRKEMGNIYLRPFTQNSFMYNGQAIPEFPIPPYFPADGMFAPDGSYMERFSDVLNRMTPTQQQYMRVTTQLQAAANSDGSGNAVSGSTPIYLTDTDGKSWTTGQDYGPYVLTTQGLKPGAGYAANASAGSTDPSNWSTTGSDYMIPDTSPKYVLAYRYRIDLLDGNAVSTESSVQRFNREGNNANYYRRSSYLSDVKNIRAALYLSKFRWQEIDVNSGNVQIYSGLDSLGNPIGSPDTYGTAVIINLDTPLPSGLQWEIQFDKGCFVDEAINEVEPLSYGGYWFWTEGVQAPVIRVDRKSMDYRNITNLMSEVASLNTADPFFDSSDVDERGNLDSFNSVYFRVESETPGAHIGYSTYSGHGNNSVYIPTTLNGNAMGTTTAWNARHAATSGTWVTPNLVRRSTASGLFSIAGDNVSPLAGLQYSANGVQYNGNGSLWIFRSYNRDANESQLSTAAEGVTSLSLGNKQSSLAIRSGSDPLRAGKYYVVANANVNTNVELASNEDPASGYEGIFVTLVALRDSNNTGEGSAKIYQRTSSPVQIFGSNNQNPTPSIMGFPLMLSNSDLRYLKLPYNNNGNAGGTASIFWISTEIVSPWFITFASLHSSSDIMSRCFSLSGEAGSYLTGGYGDLSYSYNYDEKH